MFKNEDIKIASNHLQLARQEIEECSDGVYETLQKVGENLPAAQEKIVEALTFLQFQDIITQRLKKVEEFLQIIDKSVDLKSSQEFLEEFAWENEVDQEDIDKMFNEG